ncbi:MAG: signal peptidase II [Defluviitaleaceae bacterium]|nr:signal peptidase II [Defluviitaleaceae bacterium]
MKIKILPIIILASICQITKVIIYNFFMDAEFTIIPRVFYFTTTFNTYRGYIASLLGITIPAYLSIIFVTIFALLFFIVTKYLFYYMQVSNLNKYTHLLNLSLTFMMAAFLSRVADSIFWPGVLDFVLMFDWFIFDITDVYAQIIKLIFIFLGVYIETNYYKLPKTERKQLKKQTNFLNWLKLGMPT